MNHSRLRSRLALAIVALAGSSTCWADSPPDAAAPTEPAGWVATAYLDSSYAYLTGNGRFTSGVPDRVFDTDRNGVSLRQAAGNLAFQPKEGFGGVLNVTLGDDANIIKAYNGAFSAAHVDLTQAFVQYATNGLTIMAGKLVTLAGSEVIASPANTNASRSILFGFAVPFTNTGLRATYAVNDVITTYLGVNNGWDDVKDTNSGKTLEAGASVTPSKAVSVAAYGYFGQERVAGLVGYGPQGERSLIDLQATWNLTDALSFVANYDWGRQANAGLGISDSSSAAVWHGLALYGNYTINAHWKSSLRAEYLNDPQGYRTGVAQTWHEVTETIAYLPNQHLELRAEIRGDGSDVSTFQYVSGVSKKNQAGGAIQVLLKY